MDLEPENNKLSNNNFVQFVNIKNFKSIRDLRLDCKRINVFIGKPNMGKSNVLDALGFLGAGYDQNRFLKGSIRFNELRDLFYDYNNSKTVEVKTEKLIVTLDSIDRFFDQEYPGKFLVSSNTYRLGVIHVEKDDNWKDCWYELEMNGCIRFANIKRDINKVCECKYLLNSTIEDPECQLGCTKELRLLKKYDIAQFSRYTSSFQEYLQPPNGANLYAVIRSHPTIMAEFADRLNEHQLELTLIEEAHELVLQKRVGKQIKQDSLTPDDSIHQFMFYLAAIESNLDSVIVLEEPEVVSFPPYIHELAQRMILSDKNQFFVSTNSPYLLKPLLEKLTSEELNIFITYHKDYETKVHALTPEEIRSILDLRIDVFFNVDKFSAG